MIYPVVSMDTEEAVLPEGVMFRVCLTAERAGRVKTVKG
jgi:hypothetical protein